MIPRNPVTTLSFSDTIAPRVDTAAGPPPLISQPTQKNCASDVFVFELALPVNVESFARTNAPESTRKPSVPLFSKRQLLTVMVAPPRIANPVPALLLNDRSLISAMTDPRTVSAGNDGTTL